MCLLHEACVLRGPESVVITKNLLEAGVLCACCVSKLASLHYGSIIVLVNTKLNK